MLAERAAKNAAEVEKAYGAASDGEGTRITTHGVPMKRLYPALTQVAMNGTVWENRQAVVKAKGELTGGKRSTRMKSS